MATSFLNLYQGPLGRSWKPWIQRTKVIVSLKLQKFDPRRRKAPLNLALKLKDLSQTAGNAPREKSWLIVNFPGQANQSDFYSRVKECLNICRLGQGDFYPISTDKTWRKVWLLPFKVRGKLIAFHEIYGRMPKTSLSWFPRYNNLDMRNHSILTPTDIVICSCLCSLQRRSSESSYDPGSWWTKILGLWNSRQRSSLRPVEISILQWCIL
jgi:hypothetical protein